MTLAQLKKSREVDLAHKEELDGVHQRLSTSKGIANRDRDILLDLLSKEIETVNWGIIGLETSIAEAEHMESVSTQRQQHESGVLRG